MPKLTILRGISGSGKSTWAREQNAVVVSRDDLRVAFFNDDSPTYYEVPREVLREREDFISTVEQAAIKSALLSGKDVVSDNTHTMMKYVNRVAKIGWAVDADVELKIFDVPLSTVLSRVKMRAEFGGRAVPEEAIRRQHDQFQGSKNHVLIHPPKVRPYAGTPGKPQAFLVDIDGTLAHMRDYRGPFEWHNVHLDDMDEIVADIVFRLGVNSSHYDDRYKVIVMSGRDKSSESLTINWLNDNAIPWDAIFMRPEGDMRPDNIVKAELFDNYVRDNWDVKFVLDDRDQVVDMWRRMGLKCLQVEPGAF